LSQRQRLQASKVEPHLFLCKQASKGAAAASDTMRQVKKKGKHGSGARGRRGARSRWRCGAKGQRAPAACGSSSSALPLQRCTTEQQWRCKRSTSMLYVPAGKWLTGPFNLTSHFTLFLHSDAVILASELRAGSIQLR